MNKSQLQKFLGVFALSLCLIVSGCGKKRHSGFKSSHSMKNSDNHSKLSSEFLSHDRIFFELNEYEIIDEHSEAVKSIVTFLKHNPNLKVTIEGFCDRCGTFAYNMSLSQRRANSLLKTLKLHGIDESRINTVGYGYQFVVPHGQEIVSVKSENGQNSQNRAARVLVNQ